jgi:hypothetical protein
MGLKMDTKIYLINLKGERPLGRHRPDGRIILKLILENWVWECGLHLYGLGQCPVAGSFEQGNEPWVP